MAGCSGEKASGSLVIGTSKAVDTMNPLMAEMAISAEVFTLVYDSLTKFNENHETIPCLAESWELSDDQLTWTFTLVDTNWHDGEPFTSSDVKWTYDTLLENDELGYMYRDFLDGITEISCPDDRTLVIQTEAPKANMLMGTAPILPEHIWGELSAEDMTTYDNPEAVGTGPFSFVEKTETSVSMSKNEDYFGDIPKVDNMTFVLYDSSDSMAQALKTGEIDATTSIGADQKATIQKEESLDVITGETNGFTQIAVNVYPDGKGNVLLRDLAVRKAIEYATDKAKAIEMFYDNAGEPGTTLLIPSDRFHYSPTGDELRDFDLDKANALLDEAGYTAKDGNGIREDADGAKLSFTLINIADNTDEIKFAQVIKEGCLEAGIEINLTTMDSGALIDAAADYDYDMFIWGWGGDVDPTIMLSILTTDQIGGSNEPGWSNEKYDALIKEQATIMDDDARIAKVQEAQKIAYDDAPYIILVYDNYTQAYNKDKWEGFEQIPDGGTFFYNLTNLNYLNVAPK